MKLEEKLIQNVRINAKRSLALREAVKKIEDETGTRVRESEIVNFLIDECLKRIAVRKDTLKVL